MPAFRVFGIVGSPRKGGNTDLLISQVLEGAKSARAETGKIYLNDLRIRPCQSCGKDPRPKFCLFDDGMKIVYDALQSYDAIVLGSPVYFDTVSAQTKLMIDRSNCLMPYVQRANGSSGFERRIEKSKKGVFISVAGMDQEFKTILTTVKGFFHWANINLVETILYPHGDNQLGNVKNSKEKIEQAFEVGVRLTKMLLENKRHE
jgi:multimeric flavodoxin WrbA